MVCINSPSVGVPQRWEYAKPGEVEGQLYKSESWVYTKRGRIQKRNEGKMKYILLSLINLKDNLLK